MMIRERTCRKGREKGDNIGEVRISTGNKIYKITDHLLIEVLFEGFFFFSCRLKAAFRVEWCRDCAGVVYAKAFTYLYNVLVLAKSDDIRSVGDFNASNVE